MSDADVQRMQYYLACGHIVCFLTIWFFTQRKEIYPETKQFSGSPFTQINIFYLPKKGFDRLNCFPALCLVIASISILRLDKLLNYPLPPNTTTMHSSRMRTARVLTVSHSMLCTGGCTWSRGWGVPGPGVSGTPPLWTEFLTDTSENITLPQTSFAGGKKGNWEGD